MVGLCAVPEKRKKMLGHGGRCVTTRLVPHECAIESTQKAQTEVAPFDARWQVNGIGQFGEHFFVLVTLRHQCSAQDFPA